MNNSTPTLICTRCGSDNRVYTAVFSISLLSSKDMGFKYGGNDVNGHKDLLCVKCASSLRKFLAGVPITYDKAPDTIAEFIDKMDMTADELVELANKLKDKALQLDPNAKVCCCSIDWDNECPIHG